MFYFAPGDPRLTEIRVTYAPRVILVPFPVGVGILKSSSCLTGRLILIHTEKARPDRSRPLFQTFRKRETKWQLIRETRPPVSRFGNLRNFDENIIRRDDRSEFHDYNLDEDSFNLEMLFSS